MVVAPNDINQEIESKQPMAVRQDKETLSSSQIYSRALIPYLHESAQFLAQFFNLERLVLVFEPRIGHGLELPPVEWISQELSHVQEELYLNLVQRLRSMLVEEKGIFRLSPLELTAVCNSELHLGAALLCELNSEDQQNRLTIICFSGANTDFSSTDTEILHSVGTFVLRTLSELTQQGEHEQHAPAIKRLFDSCRQLAFNISSLGVFNFVNKTSLNYFGLMPIELIGKRALPWFSFVAAEDEKHAVSTFLEMSEQPSQFEIDCQVVNQVTGVSRKVRLIFSPVLGEKKELVSWDVVSEDKQNELELQDGLVSEQKKVRLLYLLSDLVTSRLDLEYLIDRALATLISTTDSESGLVVAWDGEGLELLYASSGTDNLQMELKETGIAGYLRRVLETVARDKTQLIVRDGRSDPRVNQSTVVVDAGLLSCCAVPIQADGSVYGALILFSKRVGHYSGEHVMLLQAAASHIAVVARELTLAQTSARQTKVLSALYRINRELFKSRALEEIFQQAFNIIQEELGLKRLWLGLLNDRGDMLVGQAAFGAGWKRALVEMQLPLTGEDNPLMRVVAEKRAVLVTDTSSVMEELGLKKIFSRFGLSSLVFAPLLANDQVLGVLAVQPMHADAPMGEDEIALLSSLANEIAGIILTKQLEARLAEGERMRSTGLLAAGIAHNFNNLLQAILGQASLLEMQYPSEVPVSKATQIIVEAANRGASLVRQLTSFANLEEAKQAPIRVDVFIDSIYKNLSDLLKPNQHLLLSMKNDLPLALVDQRHLQRILGVLVTNASEAMGEKGGPVQIFTDFVDTELDHSHVEVPAGRYMRIGVRDSGIGMDAETKKRCFEPFFTTKNVDPTSGLGLKGTGLGLAQAYALARKNGGRLTVESRLGLGTIFMLYLPVYEKSPLTGVKKEYPNEREAV